MLMACHHLNPRVPEDLAFAESRIRATTMMAEDVLHDLGAMSITSSDAQAMGRIGEVITRTWQVAHAMKHHLGGTSSLPADNERARRYVAKYTINPAIAHGIDYEVGSIEVGKLADLVRWNPVFFGIRPDLVIKGGLIVLGQMGDPNATLPTPQPVWMREAFGASTGVAPFLSTSFVAPAALEGGLEERLGLSRRLSPIGSTREVTKADMVNNHALPSIQVDPETFMVTIDGEQIVPTPVAEVPLAQRYTLF